MLLVIFGAGASFDSGSSYPPVPDVYALPPRQFGEYIEVEMYRPPLTKDLFSNRFGEVLQRYPRLTGLASHLPRLIANGTTLEAALEAVRQEAETEPGLAGELLVLRYYLRDALGQTAQSWLDFTHGVTNYVDLMRTVGRWRQSVNTDVILVNFNYDHLLERACAAAVGPGDQPAWRDHYRLFQVHGFVGWAREVTFDPALIPQAVPEREWRTKGAWAALSGELGRYLPTMAAELQLTGHFTLYGEVPDELEVGKGIIPAIAVPTVQKDNFECSPAQLERLAALLPGVTRLLIVGWRGMEDHFLALWKDATRQQGPGPEIKRIQVVDASDDGATTVLERLRANAGILAEDARISTAGFSGFLGSGELQGFLTDE